MIEEINDNKNNEFEAQFQELIQTLSQEAPPSEERLLRIKDRVIKKNFPQHIGEDVSQNEPFEAQVSSHINNIIPKGNFFSRLWINHSTFILTSASLITLAGISYFSYQFFGKPHQEQNSLYNQQQAGKDSSNKKELIVNNLVTNDSNKLVKGPNESKVTDENSGSLPNNIDSKQVPDEKSSNQNKPDNQNTNIDNKQAIDEKSSSKNKTGGINTGINKNQPVNSQSTSQNKTGSINNNIAKNQSKDANSSSKNKSGNLNSKSNDNKELDEQSFQEPIPKGVKITKREVAFITIQTNEFKDERFNKAFKEINSFFERKSMAFISKGNKLITKWNYYKGLNPDLCLKLRMIINKENRGTVDGIVIRTEEYSQDKKKVPGNQISNISLKKFFDDLQSEIIRIFKGSPTLK